MSRSTEGSEEAKTFVLIVDDDDDFRQTFRLALIKRGYEVIDAGSGEEAHRLADLHGQEIDALVMDIVLPDSWGASLAQGLIGTRSDVAVVFTSGYTESDPIIRAGVGHGTHFLTKPFGIQELVDMIEHALENRSA
jgi:two-component system cell cycle sensor histidine kinase/response regulator CckA